MDTSGPAAKRRAHSTYCNPLLWVTAAVLFTSSCASDGTTDAVVSEQTDAVSEQVVSQQTDAVSEEVVSEQTDAVSEEVVSEQTDAVSEEVVSEPTDAVSQQSSTVPVGAAADAAAASTTTDSEPDDDSAATPSSPTTNATSETIADRPSTSGPPPTSTCSRLTDFDDVNNGDGWVVVNDGVMGGRSQGAMEFSGTTMRFTGTLVTAGGGFTSVRLSLVGGELADSEWLRLRVRSDDRTYGLTMEDGTRIGRRPISHQADLNIDSPADAEGWRTTELRYNQLATSVFGQPVDAPPFEPNQATEIGIIIGDGVDGSFAIDLDWIDACRTS